MRLVERDTTSDGAHVTRTISGVGIVVRLAHVDGRKPSDVRRDFNRYCRQNGIVATPCEFSQGHYSPRTGKAIPGSEPVPSAYQCVGAPDALGALAEHFTIGEWSFALNVALPRAAQGSGPEKVRSAMGSAFGQRAQIAATAEALAKDRTNAIRASRAGGR